RLPEIGDDLVCRTADQCSIAVPPVTGGVQNCRSGNLTSYGRWRLRGESKGELQAMAEADGAQSVEESREESWEESEDQMWRDETRWVRGRRPESRRCDES
ncbi:hypothetical protein SLEP1_g56613, partial [Rubroshorea leprosula]